MQGCTAVESCKKHRAAAAAVAGELTLRAKRTRGILSRVVICDASPNDVSKTCFPILRPQAKAWRTTVEERQRYALPCWSLGDSTQGTYLGRSDGQEHNFACGGPYCKVINMAETPPPLHNVDGKPFLWRRLSNVAHHWACRIKRLSIPCGVCYIVQ